MTQPQEEPTQLELTNDDIGHLLASIAEAVRSDPVQGLIARWYAETHVKLYDFHYSDPSAERYVLTKIVAQEKGQVE